jgi:uncharacterized protein YuzE
MVASLDRIYEIIPNIVKLPSKKLWVDYDEDADVLYISFEKPQHATDSELLENNVLVRYKNGNIVGITIIGVNEFIKRTR